MCSETKTQEDLFNLAKMIVLKLDTTNRKRLSDCLEGMHHVKIAAESSTGNRAATMESLIRPLTLHAIRNVAKSKNVDPESECELMYDCLLSELSENIAQHFLNHLRAIDKPSSVESVNA